MGEAGWVTTAVLILDWIIRLGLGFHVIMRRQAASASLAWLAVIFGVPLLGALSYIAFGEKRLGRRRAKRAEGLIEHYAVWQDALTERADVNWSAHRDRYRRVEREVVNVTNLPALQGNGLHLLKDADDVFRSLIDDIDRAESTVHMLFYIWSDGGIADEVAEALIRAAERGVTCRLLVDAIGSAPFLKGKTAARMRKAGVNVVVALPVNALRVWFVRADLRNHRKIAVFDGKIGYTGSQNLADPRFFKQSAGVGQWVDTMVRVEGPAVEVLAAVFIADWELETGQGLQALKDSAGVHPVPEHGDAVVQVVPSGPGRHPEAIHQLLVSVMYSADSELVMTTPYFVPDDATVLALKAAALRGADVSLVVPMKNDSKLSYYAGRGFYDELLSAGVRIFEFRGGLLHAKTVTIDGSFSLIGSVNLDMRSLWLDFEISLFVFDPAFTRTLRERQESFIANSAPVELETWRRRSARPRILENVARLAGPLL